MTMIGLEPRVLTSRKQPGKNIPDKVMLPANHGRNARVRFGSSELPKDKDTVQGNPITDEVQVKESVSTGDTSTTQQQDESPLSKAIDRLAEQVTQFLKRLQEKLETWLKKVGDYLEPSKKDEQEPPTSTTRVDGDTNQSTRDEQQPPKEVPTEE
jgi:hypothetical protein